MRVLIVKMSSLGDVIHTLAALTDARCAIPDIQFDWVVEEAFAEIPAWHPAVDRVIPIALRRWRKRPLRSLLSGEWRAFRRHLRKRNYDCVLDAQGLIKSAWVSRKARGPRYGLDAQSAREPLAAHFYQHPLAVTRGQHAVVRLRQLFARVLGYDEPVNEADYGIDRQAFAKGVSQVDSLVFLHGTTWETKHWPEPYWHELASQASIRGYEVLLPWGNDAEKARAARIAEGVTGARVLEKMPLAGLARVIAQAGGVIGVDTGLIHLAAALGVPSVSVYGPTDPVLTGAFGRDQVHITADIDCAPCLSRHCTFSGESLVKPACFEKITPPRVLNALPGDLS